MYKAGVLPPEARVAPCVGIAFLLTGYPCLAGYHFAYMSDLFWLVVEGQGKVKDRS